MKSPPLLLLAAPLLLALPSHCADRRLQEQLECDPSEFLLAVRFQAMTEEQWDGAYVWFPTVTVSTLPGPDGWLNETKYTSEFADLVDYERCAPRDGPCLNVVLDGFPKGTYEVTRDGEAVAYDLEFVKQDDNNKTIVSAVSGMCLSCFCTDTHNRKLPGGGRELRTRVRRRRRTVRARSLVTQRFGGLPRR